MRGTRQHAARDMRGAIARAVMLLLDIMRVLRSMSARHAADALRTLFTRVSRYAHAAELIYLYARAAAFVPRCLHMFMPARALFCA